MLGILIGVSIFIDLVYIVYYIKITNLKKKRKKGRLIFKLIVNLIVISCILALLDGVVYFITDAGNKKNIDDNTTTKEVETTAKKEEPTTKKTSSVKVVSKEYPKLDYIEGDREEKGFTSKGYLIEEVNGVTYIDGYMIANKTYGLPENYVPKNATLYRIAPVAQSYLNDLFKAAKEAGYDLKDQSGYRSYSVQKNLYNNALNRGGKEDADRYSARPGHSEHQTGYAMDICDKNYMGACISTAYDKVPSAKWLSDNCWKYGFILRYVKGKENETGYGYESWHFRYVGKDLAEILYNNGDWLTMEDYFGITSVYED